IRDRNVTGVQTCALPILERKKEATIAIRKHASAVRKSGKQGAPVTPPHVRKKYGKPGDLKGSIRVKYYYGGLGALIMPWRPKGSHRFVVELGTKDRVTRTGKRLGRVTPQRCMGPDQAK